MPAYPYVCDKCGHVATEFCTISQYRRQIPCVQCSDGTQMRRSFAGKGPHSLDVPYQHPIEMFSIAPNNPTELMAFQRRNPNVRLNDQMVPVVRSRQEKLRVLRNEGFEEKN